MTRGNIEAVTIALRMMEQGEDYCGVCLECGEEAGGVEPDAENYKCECCGVNAVMGAEQIVLCYG